MKFVRDTDYKLRNVDCIKSIEEIFTTAPNGYEDMVYHCRTDDGDFRVREVHGSAFRSTIAAEPGETRDYKAEAEAKTAVAKAEASSTNRGAVNWIGREQ